MVRTESMKMMNLHLQNEVNVPEIEEIGMNR